MFLIFVSIKLITNSHFTLVQVCHQKCLFTNAGDLINYISYNLKSKI